MKTANEEIQNHSGTRDCQVFTLADFRKGDRQPHQPSPIAEAAGSDQPVLQAQRAPKRIGPVQTAVKGCPGLCKVTHPDGREEWVYRYSDPVTGKRPRIQIGDCRHVDEIAARIAVRTFTQRIQAGLSPRVNALTLAAYFDEHYLPWAQAHKRSWRDDLSRFNQYIRADLGQRAMVSINERQIKALGDQLREGGNGTARRERLADSTVNAVLNLFKAIYREAHGASLVDHNPAKRVKLLKVDNLRHEVYSDAEVALILPALRALNLLAALLFAMLLGTGARIGELLNARHADVDEAAGTLRLSKTKSGRPMTLPLSTAVLALYAELKTLARDGNPHLFPARHGSGPMSPPRKVFQQVLADLGIRNRTWHDARRTAISKVVQMPGLSVLDASRLANHASVRLTETRYVVVGQDRLRLAVEGLSRALPLGLAIAPIHRLQPSVRSVAVNDHHRFITALARCA